MSTMDSILGDQMTAQLRRITCARQGCHCIFAIPAVVDGRLRETHEEFYCPFGHVNVYLGDNEKEHLAKELARERAAHDQTKAARDLAWKLEQQRREERDGVQRQLAATKGVVTRVKNRVARGICPCCDRYFRDLHSHLAHEHPEFEKKDD